MWKLNKNKITKFHLNTFSLKTMGCTTNSHEHKKFISRRIVGRKITENTCQINKRNLHEKTAMRIFVVHTKEF